MRPRIILEIERGVLQRITSTTKDMDLHIVDYDNLKAGEDPESIYDKHEPDSVIPDALFGVFLDEYYSEFIDEGVLV